MMLMLSITDPPLFSLRRLFHCHSGFLDSELFKLLDKNDFSEDAWTVLSMLHIPTAKDLIERLAETNKDGGLDTHFSVIHQEFKNYLTKREFPLDKQDILPAESKKKPLIGDIDDTQQNVHLTSVMLMDYKIMMESATCHEEPQEKWHTKLTLENTSLRSKSTYVLRANDNVNFAQSSLHPMQVEHLGFEGTNAKLRFYSKLMNLSVS
jgi:hypothetical protein